MKYIIPVFFLSFIAVVEAMSQEPVRDTIGNVKEVRIDPKDEWTSTGILINPETIYTVTVRGIVSAVVEAPYSWLGPEGNGYPAPDDYTLPGFSSYCVVGKIGAGGSPFIIGSQRRFKLKDASSDILYLGYNDKNGYFFDNGGIFIAEIDPATDGVTSVRMKDGSYEPTSFAIRQNYPNPFNPSTNIEYQIAKGGDVEVGIYDVNGRPVRSLLNQFQLPGSYILQWDGKDEFQQTVASGSYFYQVKTTSGQLVKKMLLVK